MSWDNLFKYDSYLRYLTSAINLTGFDCTVLIPNNQVNLGYETTPDSLYTDRGTSYSRHLLKGYIDFQATRSVFYKFNLDPTDPENAGLLPAFFLPNDLLKEGSYIRTGNNQGVSVWGDLKFEVVRTVDTGKYRTLIRTYFIRGVSSSEVDELFSRYE